MTSWFSRLTPEEFLLLQASAEHSFEYDSIFRCSAFPSLHVHKFDCFVLALTPFQVWLLPIAFDRCRRA